MWEKRFLIIYNVSFLEALRFSSGIFRRCWLPVFWCGFATYLVAGWILFTIGCMCDNWYYNHRFPEKLMELLLLYFRYFLTVRNGLFYGFFFVSLGLWFAKTKKQIPLGVGAGGFAVFVLFMFLEVRHCENVNLVFSAAPAS